MSVFLITIYMYTYMFYREMRRKKEASKVKQTTRQSNIAHSRQSLFLRKMSCLSIIIWHNTFLYRSQRARSISHHFKQPQIIAIVIVPEIDNPVAVTRRVVIPNPRKPCIPLQYATWSPLVLLVVLRSNCVKVDT